MIIDFSLESTSTSWLNINRNLPSHIPPYMKSFRKTFASIPLRLTVFAVILLGMCLRGGERAGVITSSSVKKKDDRALPVLGESHPSAEENVSREKSDGPKGLSSFSAQESSQTALSNLSSTLSLPVEKGRGEGVHGGSHTELFKKASGLSTVDK